MPTGEGSNLKEIVRQLPDTPGVYLMKDRLGNVLYVGKAKHLKRRVSSYFQPSRRFTIEQPKIAAMLDLIADVEVIQVASNSEAILLEGKLIKERRPRYNTDFVDDKHFLHIRLDLNVELPRFRLVRFRGPDRALYFGPFAHSGLLRKTMDEMRGRFGILLADAHPREVEPGVWRLYDDARAEIFGHANQVTAAEYRERVNRACAFLEGKAHEWIAEIEVQMQKAAALLNFERAAHLRDVLDALRKTTLRTRKFAHIELGPADTLVALQALQQAIDLPTPPTVMECFDISHISGTFCVASMVQFVDGQPLRRNYRRFQIKSFIGNDDFRAMHEVVSRRYVRLQQMGKPFPDLVVIDGGSGQVAAALRAFLQNGLEPPSLIGLAKREERIVFSDGRAPLLLPGHHRGRLLLQHVRDEAHRHANAYNAQLRSRKLRESVLDDLPGLGPKLRHQLFAHFGSLEALLAAPEAALRDVEGVGGLRARQIFRFLRENFAAKRSP